MSKIEWTQKTWNPVHGCTKISPGCKNCYAEKMANRLSHMGAPGYSLDDPFKATCHQDRLNQPLKWKKPRMVFVCSMGDLFHEDVPDKFIYAVWSIMLSCPQHTFQVLTKRPERMRQIVINRMSYLEDAGAPNNIWLGVTAENREMADKRIPILLDTPAAKRFVSVEPMLSEVLIVDSDLKPDWVICGCESGQNRRDTNIEWIRSLRDQCIDNGIPFFLKQMEIDGKVVKMPELDGKVWDQIPEIKHVKDR